MSWSGAHELRAQLVRLWERGELLRDTVTGQSRFPLRLPFKAPSSADVTDRFEAVRAWVAELAGLSQVRVEWQEVRHRVHGAQRQPASVWIDTLDGALGWIGKRADAKLFAQVVASTRARQPALLPWLEKRPLQALALAHEWDRLLTVVAWMGDNPRPGIYLRQVDLAGVHSKYLENHRGVLGELLDMALPASAIDDGQRGIAQFAARFGFLDKPARVRFRILDPKVQAIPGAGKADITLDADSFSSMLLGVRTVFITENETNFLAFPDVDNALVLFGAGYGWNALARARWLDHCALHYWGDLDTHGFAILDQLRSHFPHVASFLMDRETLEAHRPFWGSEEAPVQANLFRLTAQERDLYDDLRYNHLQPGLRLEQEHIRYGWLQDCLRALAG